MSGKHDAAAHGIRLMQYVTAETTRTSPERIEETQWKGIKNMAYGKGNGVEIQHMKHVIGYIYYLYEAYVLKNNDILGCFLYLCIIQVAFRKVKVNFFPLVCIISSFELSIYIWLKLYLTYTYLIFLKRYLLKTRLVEKYRYICMDKNLMTTN